MSRCESENSADPQGINQAMVDDYIVRIKDEALPRSAREAFGRRPGDRRSLNTLLDTYSLLLIIVGEFQDSIPGTHRQG